MSTLSMCIPTYNRASYLESLLDSVYSQHHGLLEIVISDDCSVDNTESVVMKFKDKLPNIRYFRHSVNIGLDNNFIFLADQALGDYIWFFGDDDKLEVGAVSAVTKALELWPGICGITVGVIDYDENLSIPVGLRATPETQTFDSVEAVFATIPDLLGFISSLIINRGMWQAVCRSYEIENFKNLYLQVYIIGRVVENFHSWAVLSKPCVSFRTSNDQFLSKLGWYDRLKADIKAYEQISFALFCDQKDIQKLMTSKIFSVHILGRIRNIKTSEEKIKNIHRLLMLIYKHYGHITAFWYVALPTILAPKWLIRILRIGYKRLSKNSGTQRAKAFRS